MAIEPQVPLFTSARPNRAIAFALRDACIPILLAVSLISVQFAVPTVAAAQEESAGEYEIKAAMLYNLMQFVEWPPSAYAAEDSPRVLCVLGWDPFGNSLASLVSDKVVDGRHVQIRHVTAGNQVRACHVLYISSSERKHLPEVFSQLSGASVLTVGEMSHFAERGGMVQFALEENHVRFEINLDAASRSDLRISARLLALARIVKFKNKDSISGDSTAILDAMRAVRHRFPHQLFSIAEHRGRTLCAFDDADRRNT